MTEVINLGKVSASGGFKLFIGKVISAVILALSTIVLGLYLEDSGYGLYSIALIPVTTALLFQDWGVNSALTRTTANLRSKNQTENIRKNILSGFAFEGATGIALTLILLLASNFISSSVYNKPESGPLLSIASLTILFISITLTCQAVFAGFERMGLYSCTSIFQAVAQCVLIPLLVFMGYGALGAVIGYTVSIGVSCLFSIILLYFKIYRNLSSSNSKNDSLYLTLKPLLGYGLPLAFSTIIGGLLPQICSLIMGSVVDLATIGNYRIALNFAVLLTFFITPITTVLFPTFSKIDPNDKQMMNSIFASSVKYTCLLLLPATVAIIVLSQPVIGTIYGTRFLLAPTFLAFYAAGHITAIFGLYSLNSLFYALSETKFLLKLSLVSLLIGILMAFILIPQFGILGLILTNIIAEVPIVFLGVYWAWKRYGVTVDFMSSVKILSASVFSGALTYLLINLVHFTNLVELIFGATIFILFYLLFCPLLGAISQSDIRNLRQILSETGPMVKIIQIPLLFMEKLKVFFDYISN